MWYDAVLESELRVVVWKGVHSHAPKDYSTPEISEAPVPAHMRYTANATVILRISQYTVGLHFNDVVARERIMQS